MGSGNRSGGEKGARTVKEIEQKDGGMDLIGLVRGVVSHAGTTQ